MAYAPGIASSPDDLASQLERLFDHQPGDDDPVVVTDDAPESEPTVAAEVLAELTAQMDLLRDQLDQAFEEVVGRVHRVELRLADLRSMVDGVATGTDRVEGTSSDALLVARQVLSALEKASAASQEPQPAPEPLDLGSIERRIDLFDVDLRAVVEQLDALRTTPVIVDTRHLEEAARSGSLHNAADIANLRQDIEDVAETVRRQDKGLDELRATLDWIKERLLLR